MPKIGGARSGAIGAKKHSKVDPHALWGKKEKKTSHTAFPFSIQGKKYKCQRVTENNSSKETGWAQKTHTRQTSELLFK